MMNDQRKRPPGRPSKLDANLVRTLGWFSIGLGLAEALLPSPVARAGGMNGDTGLVRSYGAREIANGIGVLAARDPAPWIWARVAGDAMDLVTLAARGGGARTLVAFVAVAGVTALDIACATRLARAPRRRVRDYSARSGLPAPPEEMRGAARRELRRAVPAL